MTYLRLFHRYQRRGERIRELEARIEELVKENQCLKWELGREPDPRLNLGKSVTLDKLPKVDSKFRVKSPFTSGFPKRNETEGEK